MANAVAKQGKMSDEKWLNLLKILLQWGAVYSGLTSEW
jgi:hypothetical protein